MKWNPLLLTFALPFTCAALQAQEAAFSDDGKHVYYLRSGTSVIVDISLDSKPGEEWAKHELEKHVGDDARLISICRGKDHSFILATGSAVYSWLPGSAPKKTLDLPKEHLLTDTALDAKSGRLVTPALVERDDQGHAQCLLIRRPAEDELVLDESLPQAMKCPRFDAEGRLFFGIGASLYTAGWVAQEEGAPPDFVAWAYAPLDVAPLANGTSNDELTISGIAPAGKWLYVSLISDVDAMLVRLPRPVVNAKNGWPAEAKELNRKNQWKRFSTTLSAIESFDSESQPYFSSLRALCASPDGSMVFYSGIPILHPEREEYWTRSVKSGEQDYHGSNPLE